MNAQVTVETINPTTAASWLENRLEEQRPIRENHVARLTSEIKHGKFRLTSDALVLLKGRLANGQHRLSAVVNAGKSAQFIVMRTSDDELYKVIDCGAIRSTGDVLHGMTNAKLVASTAKLVLSYDRHGLTPAGENVTGNGDIITRSAILDYIECHAAELADHVHFALSRYQKTRICSPTIAAAFLNIASRKHPAKAKEFIDAVYEGTSIDASKDFRDRMIKQMGTKSRLRQSYVFALLIKAWKSYLNGTRPGTLKMAEGEVYPEIA